MALTKEELSKVFYGQGFVFDMLNPATLSRYTIMEKTGIRRKYSPVTLDKVLARNPKKFLDTVEQHLRDGNVLCYDSRARDVGKPTSLKLNDNNTVKYNENFKDVPESVVPQVKYRRWKQMWTWVSPKFKAEITAYDDAVRRNTLREAQLAHFNMQQQIKRTIIYSTKERSHINAIEHARSAGHSVAPLHGFDSSDEFILQHPHLLESKTPLMCRTLNEKRSKLLGKTTPVDPYDTDMDRPEDTKENVYSAALSRRPKGYRADNPNPDPKKPRIPSVLSGEFYMVLDSKKTLASNSTTVPINYSKYIDNIESMLDHDQPYPKKLLFEQNQGTKEMWTMCQTISQEITQNMQKLRELDGITDPAKQLATTIPIEQGGNASANLSVVDSIDVNSYCKKIISANRERIRCLKELVVSVASNSSAITEENQQTLRECGTLSAFLEKVEDAFDKKQDISALKMEDSREQGDREINSLLESPEIVERMRPMEVRVQENNALIEKEQAAEKQRQQEIDNQRQKELDHQKELDNQRQKELDHQKELDNQRQKEIDRRNNIIKESDDQLEQLKKVMLGGEDLEDKKIEENKPQEPSPNELRELAKKVEAERLAKIKETQERLDEERRDRNRYQHISSQPPKKQTKEEEEKALKWKEEAPLRLATDQKLKEIWRKEDFAESELIKDMTRYGIQNYANARLKKANDSIEELRNNSSKTYEEGQILKHLIEKVRTVYTPLVKKYTDYSTAIVQDTKLMKDNLEQWKENQKLQLSEAQTPSAKSQIDKSWRVDKVFGSKPDFVDLKENGCKVNIKNVNKQVINSYSGISEITPGMKLEEKIVALNLCAALCAPFLPRSKTGKSFEKQKSKNPNELWIATGLLEGVLDGKKPPKEISALLPDALEDGRKYINEIFTQNDDLIQRNTAVMNILNRGATIMTEMLNTTLTQNPNSSWTIGAKYLNDIMRLRQICDRNKHNTTENLTPPVMAMSAGWTAAYKSHEINRMCTETISPDTMDRPYLKTAFVVDGEVQNMCVKDYMAFENHKSANLARHPGKADDPLELINIRSDFGIDHILQYNIYSLGSLDPTLEKLNANCRKESDYAKEIERCKKERLSEHDSYKIDKEKAIIDAMLEAEKERKYALKIHGLAPRKPQEAPRTLQSTMSNKVQNQKNSARTGPDR